MIRGVGGARQLEKMLQRLSRLLRPGFASIRRTVFRRFCAGGLSVLRGSGEATLSAVRLQRATGTVKLARRATTARSSRRSSKYQEKIAQWCHSFSHKFAGLARRGSSYCRCYCSPCRSSASRRDVDSRLDRRRGFRRSTAGSYGFGWVRDIWRHYFGAARTNDERETSKIPPCEDALECKSLQLQGQSRGSDRLAAC